LNSHGPLKDIHDFHRYTRQGLEADPNHDPEVSELIALQDRAWPPPVLTYGDLSSLNILVRDDTIVGIIDWEMAGWYPSYSRSSILGSGTTKYPRIISVEFGPS
jgi:aminoglycoside phosphotransferase (APT) family kinase protein